MPSATRTSDPTSGRYVELLNREYWRRRPHSMPYLRLLDRVHQHVVPRTYLEIGVSKGWSLALSLPGTVNIGVDPDPKISFSPSRTTQIFTETSDEFFRTRDLRNLLGGQPLDLAFIDGMHHFECALRDFMSIERNATPATTVLVHDCYPIDRASADRVQSPGYWSGDVWRLIVLLKERRPDLHLSVVDIGPTGLGVITGLDPGSQVLADAYDEIEAQYRSLPYEYLDRGDKAQLLNRVPADWATVRALLPSRPIRRDPLSLLVTRRAAHAGWSAVRRLGPERASGRRLPQNA